MNRRELIKAMSAGVFTSLGGSSVLLATRAVISTDKMPSGQATVAPTLQAESPVSLATANSIPPGTSLPVNSDMAELHEDLSKQPPVVVQAATASADVIISGDEFELLKQTVARIKKVQGLVGYGNFNLLGFDAMLKYARNFPKVGEFTQAELNFIDRIFFEDAARYGFFGDKVISKLTTNIKTRDTVKIPHTGHFLFKGDATKMYDKVRKDVGETIVLSSGVRGIVKQIHLFLAKTIRTNGNMSLASRSLAPPGHSYHGIGDFDVGKVGFGYKNFTADFANTDEYKRLTDLGYVLIRYTEGNDFGVRFEPWHIKVV